MTQPAVESIVSKTIGPSISTALGTLATWLAAGSTGIESALLALLSILGGICGLVFSLIYRRYLGVLGAGAEPQGSLERTAYDALRKSLGEGGSAARLYVRRLTAFLDAVDRFFGDSGMANRSLFAHAFGLNAPAPLWTAPAFDRCLFLAWLYPIVAIFLIWAISGHVGPAEAALHLKPDLPAWQRGIAVALVGFAILAHQRARRKRNWKDPWLGGLGVVGAFVGVVTISGAVGGWVNILLFFLFSFVETGAGRNVASGILVTFGSFSIIIIVGFPIGLLAGYPRGSLADLGITAASIVAAMVVVWAIDFVCEKPAKKQWLGLVLSIFFTAMIVVSVGAANVLANQDGWIDYSPLLLFLVVLALINAPFDWASLGLTRALLRRGLELAGWWPCLLALVDAVFAAVIVAMLAIAVVIGVQAFNEMAVHGGGAPLLPLDPLFDGIAANPTAPEYWWVYALLLTTMIPSLINLGIGGASLMRGLPGLTSLLQGYIPEAKTVPSFDRAWIAVVLALQVIGGVILGIVAQALIFVGVIVYVMPWFGPGLLDLARDVAVFDLPSLVWQLFAGKP
jgi:hypothetical protein